MLVQKGLILASLLIIGCTSDEDTPKVEEPVTASAEAPQPTEPKPEPKTDPKVTDDVEVLNGETEQSKATEVVAAEAAAEQEEAAVKMKGKKSDVLASPEAKTHQMSEPQVVIVNFPEPADDEESLERTFTVKASHLNVRGGPSMNFPVLRVVTAGTPVKALSVEGIWVQIEKDQYVSKSFLSETTAAAAPQNSAQ